MSLQPLPNWSGWLHHFGYTHADPFNRPMPIPSVGIFDSPDVTICFNSKWSPLLIGALSRLRYPELYIVDENHDGIWADQQATKLIGVIAGAQNPCLPQSIMETECAYYPSWYAGIEYIPYNPFAGGELPSGYDIAPFFRFAAIDTWFPDWIDDIFQGIIENTTGYLENDVFVSFFSLPTLTNPFDGLDYPTIKLTVQGTGTVKLKFLLVPFGGRVLISFDPPDIGDIFNAIWSTEDRIIELNRDILAAVPETDLDAIEELHLTEDGTHEIYATFLPTINDETPFFQFGGGFRGYEVCGDLTVINPVTGEPIDFTQTDNAYQEGVIVATEQDLYNALVRFRTEESNRWLLASSAENIKNDIEVSKTSNGSSPTIKGGFGVGGDAVEGTTQELHYGGVYNQATQFKALFDDMNDNIDATYTVTTVTNLSKLFINPLDAVAWASLISDYFTADPEININVSALALQMFCKGYSNGVLAYALANHAANEDDVNTLVNFAAEIPSSTWEQWYDEGATKPKDGYQNSNCYINSPVSYEFTPANFAINTSYNSFTIATPAQRTWRFDISGQLIGNSGDKWDGVYYISPTNVYTVNKFQWLSLGTKNMSPTNPPYSASGYGLFGDLGSDANSDFLGLRIPSIPFVSGVASGKITVKITDLGNQYTP